jgi:hypothetical protein
MGRIKIHVTPTGKGDWKVKRENASKAAGVYEDKADALKDAKKSAKSVPLGQVIVHGRDGKIQTEHTYGKDPYPPKG